MNKKVTTAVIIGGGLAGTLTAYALAKRGIRVTLCEEETHLAAGASGNSRAILMPYPGATWDARSELYVMGFSFALKQISEFSEEGSPVSGKQCGVVRLAVRERVKHVFEKMRSLHLPKALLQHVDAVEASKLCGVKVSEGGLYFPQGGWFDPREYCRAAMTLSTSLSGSVTRLRSKATRLYRDQESWVAIGADKKIFARSDIAVIANGYRALEFEQVKHLPLKKVRGEIIEVTATKKSNDLTAVLCHEGYVTPVYDGSHVAGATYDRESEGLIPSPQKQREILEKLQQHVPNLGNELSHITHSRASYRTTTKDRMPFIGKVIDHEGLYVNVGHGSRGMVTCGIGGELIAGLAHSEPLGLSAEVRHSISISRIKS